MTLAKLTDALSKCKGGETIDASGWDIEFARPKLPALSAPITIGGGIWRGLYVGGWKDVTFDGPEIIPPARSIGFRFDKGQNIHVINARAHCAPEVDVVTTNSAMIFFDQCDDSSAQDSEFYHACYGVSWRGGVNNLIQGNDAHHLYADGYRGEGGDNLKILDNRAHDFQTGIDHPDGIQVWPTDAFPGRGIEIARNFIYRGDASSSTIYTAPQGIFCQAKVGQAAKLSALDIHDNVILGAINNGISVDGQGDILNNVVVGFAGQRSWIIVRENFAGRIEGNTASWFTSMSPLVKPTKTGELAGNTKVAENMTAEQVMALYMPKEPAPDTPPETIEITLKAGQTLVVRAS